ncbi:MAG: acyltransferase, partial [Tissierellia bacterium]|nr:acyltransferase [Tissierellia bacterium]
EHVVIGAGSVVTKNISSHCVAVGNPARVVKKFDIDKKQWIRVSR